MTELLGYDRSGWDFLVLVATCEGIPQRIRTLQDLHNRFYPAADALGARAKLRMPCLFVKFACPDSFGEEAPEGDTGIRRQCRDAAMALGSLPHQGGNFPMRKAGGASTINEPHRQHR